MSLSDLFGLLRRRGWIILLLAALAAGSAYVFSKAQTPIYQATAVVLIKPTRADFGLAQTAKGLLRSYVAWLRTNDNAGRVINELKLDRAPEDLLGNVSIDPDESQFTIQVDARHEDGDEARRIARKWAELLVDWRNSENAKGRREDQVQAEIVDWRPYTQYRPQTSLNVLAGAILGALLGGVIIFVLETLESNIIRSRQDLERTLGLTVIGAIPAGKG
jgi:capsular polysaccharide biosynthesis protein